MANVLADLLVRFGADSAELRKTMKSVEGDLKRFTRDVGRMKGALTGAFAVVGIAKAARALGQLVVSGTEAADRLGKLAQSSGISVEELSKLSYAAELSDVSTQDLGTSLARLSKNMSEAAQGSKAQRDAFAALGVSVTDATGALRPANDVLLDVANAFAGAEDGAAKAAIAQELFGRAGTNLIPLLNQGASGIARAGDEAQRFGLIITEEAARAADELGDNFDRMQALGRGFALAVSQELNPALTSLSNSFIDTATAAGGLNDGAKIVSVALKGLATVALAGFTVVQTAAAKMGTAIFAAMQAARGEFADAWHVISSMRGNVLDELELGMKRINSLWSDGEGLVGTLKNTTPKRTLKIPVALKADKPGSEKAIESLQSMLEDFELKTATFGQDELGVLRYRFESGDLRAELEKAGPLAEAYKQSILDAAAALLHLEKTEKATADATAAWMEGFNAIVEDAERLYEETRTPAEKYADELERLNKLAAAGVDPALVQRGMKALAEEYDEGAKRMKEITRELGADIGSVLEENLFEGFRDGTEGMLEDFADMLRRMAAQAIAANIVGALGFGPDGATGGGLLGLFGIGARAEGGPVGSGQTYLVGERGPELFTPNLSGHIVPNDELASGAGGRRLPETVRLQLDERSSRMTVREYFEELLMQEMAAR